MKKLLILLFAVILSVLVFASCEKSDKSEKNDGDGATVTTTDGKNEGDTPSESEIKYSEGLSFVSNGDGTCYVSGIGACKDTDLVIPKVSPEGDSVTSIGGSAFRDCTELTSIAFPNSVTIIGDHAFENCMVLTSITIPDSVTCIESYAFWGCTALTSIKLPNSVTSIGISAFYNTAYYNNESNWENGVLYIGNHLIDAKETLSGSYEIKNGTKTIADFAFREHTGLTILTIPDSVMRIGEYAFFCCKRLTTITIGNGVTIIGNDAFRGCTGLTSILIGNSVTSIGEYAFSGCTGLASITIPDSVTSLGSYVFRDCTGLTSVTIPDSVTSIGDHAFEDCKGLTSVTIGNGVKSIGYEAFSGCMGLTSISVDPNNKTYHSNVNCLIETSSKILIKGCNTSIIPSDGSVTSIGDLAFRDCDGLTSITIGNGVTSIGYDAFSFCSGLTSVTISDSVTSIGNSAFYYCDELTSITFEGTKAQWKAISKGSAWNNNTGDYTVHCTDGNISKSES